MNAVVLTFDCLPVHVLGCYGNESIKTPCFDRLSAESIVYDAHFGENFSARPANHAWWTGRYQFFRSHEQQLAQSSWCNSLSASGVELRIISETGSAIRPIGQSPVDDVNCAADSQQDGETTFARLIDDAIDAVRTATSQRDRSWLIWIHGRGIHSQPHVNLNDVSESLTDWDSIQRRMSEQVVELDERLAQMLDVLRPLLKEESLLVVTADRGAHLTHRWSSKLPLFQLASAVTHLPLLIRLSNGENSGRRSELTQSVDIAPTLLDWFEIDSPQVAMEGQSLLPSLRGGQPAERDFIYLGANGEFGIRSRDFYLLEQRSGVSHDGTSARWLFAKPDDARELLDIAPQLPDVAEEMHSALDRFLAKAWSQVENRI